MKKRIFALFLALTLSALSCISVVQAATSSFPDVTSPQYDWAIKEIEDMVSKGLIKGYTDKTFKPANPVSKMEALIFAARISGFTLAQNEPFVQFAKEAYEDSLKDYSFDYKKEVSYLLYKGIISEKELDNYLGKDVINTPLLRYEAAVLLTKIVGGSVKNTTLNFTDTADIPESAKGAVSYVSTSGLMKGVGDNKFDPKGTVTRAQIAVMLYRVMDQLALDIQVGTLVSSTPSTYSFQVESDDKDPISFTIMKDTPVYLNGEDSSLEEILNGSDIAVVFNGDTIVAVEAIGIVNDETVSGVIKDVTTSSTPKISITLEDESTKTYPLSENANITLDGDKTTLSAIKPGAYAKLSLKNGRVTILAAENRDQTISGTVSEITIDPDFEMEIEFKNGDTEVYKAYSEVTVKRNGKTAELRDVLVGDSVSIVLRYNKIYSITAKSTTSTVEGTIEALTISKTPSIKVKTSDGTKEYAFSNDAEITVDGKESDMYSLRVGAYVKLKLESNTVVSISTKALSTSTQITGVIEAIQSSYGFITVNATDPKTGDSVVQQVFLKKSGSNIINADGNKIKISDLKVGQSITAVGTITNGVFEAATIIVLVD